MGFTTVKVPTITMDELSQAQKEYSFFSELKESINRKKTNRNDNHISLCLYGCMQCKYTLAKDGSINDHFVLGE